MVVATILILVFWGGLYHLTNWETVTNYFWTGVAVCAMNFHVRKLLGSFHGTPTLCSIYRHWEMNT